MWQQAAAGSRQTAAGSITMFSLKHQTVDRSSPWSSRQQQAGVQSLPSAQDNATIERKKLQEFEPLQLPPSSAKDEKGMCGYKEPFVAENAVRAVDATGYYESDGNLHWAKYDLECSLPRSAPAAKDRTSKRQDEARSGCLWQLLGLFRVCFAEFRLGPPAPARNIRQQPS